MAETGHCQHGEFILTEGCPQCLAERRATGITPALDELEDGLNDEGLTLVGNLATAKTITALALRPGEDIEVRGWHNEALKLLEYAEARVIATIEDIKAANNDLSIILKLKKAMDGKRKSLLDPLKAQMDAIRETYNYLMVPVLEADRITREKMLAYNAEQERIRAEQEKINRLRTEAAEKEMELKGELTESVDLVEVVPEAPKTIRTGLGSSGQTDHWKYEVFDFALLPDEYKVADIAMLNSIARKHHDNKQIPGVRFYNEPFISMRR